MSTSMLLLLGKEVALPIAQKILSSLNGTRGSSDKLKKAMELVENGSSVISSLRDTFGADFDKAINLSAETGYGGWSYEAGRDDYICVTYVVGEREATEVLRDELSINLDRINSIGTKNKVQMHNYFQGVLARWKERYEVLAGRDEDAIKSFAAIDSLLDGKKRTLRDAFSMLSGTGLGVGGSLLVISGAMLATSTGVGVSTMITTFLFGVPMMSVASIVIPGMILIGLSKYAFTSHHAMSAGVAAAYKLLDRRSGKN